MNLIKKCNQCGCDRVFKNQQSLKCSKSEICGKCSAKNKKLNGENNPFYGKQHSDLTKKKMSDNHADFSGDKNPFKKSLNDPEKLIKHKLRCKKIWNSRDSEYRKNFGSKLSISNCQSKNNCSYKKHKHGHFLAKNGKSYYFRSSWEEKTLQYLDILYLDGKIVKYELEPFCIFYLENNKRYGLRIDFYLETKDNKKIILECKPIGLRKYGRNPIKIKAYENYCLENNIKFVLYSNKELETIEDFWNVIK